MKRPEKRFKLLLLSPSAKLGDAPKDAAIEAFEASLRLQCFWFRLAGFGEEVCVSGLGFAGGLSLKSQE